MPIETSLPPRRLSLLIASLLAVWAPSSHAQTDDTTPFYVGGSLGVTHVANVYRTSSAPNSDTVTTTALLGGIDQRLGRQHVTLDGSLQDNRYRTNSDLDYRSYNVRGALDWQTAGNLSGVLSAKSDRSMAEFNTNNITQVFKKNIQTNDEYQALVRLGVATRVTLEAGWNHQNRDYTAWQYEQLVFSQDTRSLGIYATPAGNVRLGLVGRHTTGENPRYPDGVGVQLIDGEPRPTTSPNDYTRDDIDFTTRWSVGGHSTVNTRISRSRKRNSLDHLLRDFSGTTGAVGWDWQPTAKLQINAQYARDTGQESVVTSSELNRVYTSWQLSTNYAVTGKLSLNAKASSNRATRSRDSGVAPTDALDDTRAYTLGLRWAFSRGLSISCQYDHVSRGNSQPAYVYTASSYGCTGQAIFF